MNSKTMLAIAGIIIVAIVGYFMYQSTMGNSGMEKTDDTMMEETGEDSMMKDDTMMEEEESMESETMMEEEYDSMEKEDSMMKDDSMMEDDTTMEKDSMMEQ